MLPLLSENICAPYERFVSSETIKTFLSKSVVDISKSLSALLQKLSLSVSNLSSLAAKMPPVPYKPYIAGSAAIIAAIYTIGFIVKNRSIFSTKKYNYENKKATLPPGAKKVMMIAEKKNLLGIIPFGTKERYRYIY